MAPHGPGSRVHAGAFLPFLLAHDASLPTEIGRRRRTSRHGHRRASETTVRAAWCASPETRAGSQRSGPAEPGGHARRVVDLDIRIAHTPGGTRERLPTVH